MKTKYQKKWFYIWDDFWPVKNLWNNFREPVVCEETRGVEVCKLSRESSYVEKLHLEIWWWIHVMIYRRWRMQGLVTWPRIKGGNEQLHIQIGEMMRLCDFALVCELKDLIDETCLFDFPASIHEITGWRKIRRTIFFLFFIKGPVSEKCIN